MVLWSLFKIAVVAVGIAYIWLVGTAYKNCPSGACSEMSIFWLFVVLCAPVGIPTFIGSVFIILRWLRQADSILRWLKLLQDGPNPRV